MRLCYLVIALLTFAAAWANPFPGGHELLVQVATQWISAETGSPISSISVKPPDKRIPIKRCDREIRVRFPFIDNNKTIEVFCPDPRWKRYLRVSYEHQNVAWAFTSDFRVGTRIEESDIERTWPESKLGDAMSAKENIVGQILNQDVEAGTLVTRHLIAESTMAVFSAARAYEAGEIIDVNDLVVENRPIGPNAAWVHSWPDSIVTANNPIAAGAVIRDADIAVSEFVIVAKTTIVNGQVVTTDLVERRLEPIKELGASYLRSLEEIAGLEATRTIRSGQRIVASDLVAADLVRKDETVRLIITRGALEISVETIALENGKIDQQVLLKNPESGKTIKGIVSGRNEARGL